MKKLFFLVIIATLNLTACKNETKPASKTEPKVAIVDNTKFGIEASSNPQGLAVGSQAPNVALHLADGTVLNLEDLYKKQTLVLFFYRGYWCPVCNKKLSTFAKDAGQLEEKGVKLIAVTPETYENIVKTREKTGINFTVVSDKDDSILSAFDVAFNVTDKYQQMIQEHLKASIAETNANGQAVLPVPATYIIDTTGKIVYRQFNPNYKDRASIADILAHLPK